MYNKNIKPIFNWHTGVSEFYPFREEDYYSKLHIV